MTVIGCSDLIAITSASWLGTSSEALANLGSGVWNATIGYLAISCRLAQPIPDSLSRYAKNPGYSILRQPVMLQINGDLLACLVNVLLLLWR
jgi:hypothetical protein